MLDTPEHRRVYIVDDDASVRDSLWALLKAHKLDAVAFSTAEDFVDQCDPDSALCVFVDIRMPGMNGMELQKLLNDRGNSVPVIMLTAYGDIALAVSAMKAGAIDFIEKPGSEPQLLAAIEAAGDYLSHRPQAAAMQGPVSDRLARLTVREKEVLDHLVLGMTNKHIAEKFGISQRTIEIHRARIREKMEARGLADLIRMMR